MVEYIGKLLEIPLSKVLFGDQPLKNHSIPKIYGYHSVQAGSASTCVGGLWKDACTFDSHYSWVDYLLLLSRPGTMFARDDGTIGS
ncbi:putative aldehyde dehydrogenase [Dendrobium catenatum]|uniref:Putative aldehyde dehydrogenase n=1 Tax=Dendrobium catenatum TaxID=906689 RepID=A0A2I0W9N1_9ASPA|nr:putative aldehyde dehydrogenase [Dendrobium catenatum]